MSAFEKHTVFLFDGARARLLADMMGIPFSRLPETRRLRHAFRVLVTHVYEHSDQDTNHGKYDLKQDDVITLSERASEYFMPDRSKLEYLGAVWE